MSEPTLPGYGRGAGDLKVTAATMPDIPETTATCLSYEYGCERGFESSRMMGPDPKEHGANQT